MAWFTASVHVCTRLVEFREAGVFVTEIGFLQATRSAVARLTVLSTPVLGLWIIGHTGVYGHPMVEALR